MEKFSINTPILIPSLSRARNKTGLMIEHCLDGIYHLYSNPMTIVIAQDYSDESKELLTSKYPYTEFIWYPKIGMMEAFDETRQVALARNYSAYIYMEDDVYLPSPMADNSLLNAYESVANINPNRVGIVGSYSTSLLHFHRGNKHIISFASNPAQVLYVNTAALHNVKYDLNMAIARGDTDFTFQVARNGYLPLRINKYFSYLHCVSVKVRRTPEKDAEFQKMNDYFVKKWNVKMRKDGQHMLSPKAKELCGVTKEEILYYSKAFDKSLINNYYDEWYYKTEPRHRELF